MKMTTRETPPSLRRDLLNVKVLSYLPSQGATFASSTEWVRAIKEQMTVRERQPERGEDNVVHPEYTGGLLQEHTCRREG